MKTQNIFMSAAMLTVFLLATLSLVIRLAQLVTEVIRLTVRTIAKIDWLKGSLTLLSEFDWIFSRVNKVVNSVRSSLEDWMTSATVEPTTILSLLGENNFLNKAMKIQRFLTSAAMLTVFVFLVALSLIVQLFHSANQAFLLGCKAVKEIQKWLLTVIGNGIIDTAHSSLEDSMLSMVVKPTSQNQLLPNANSFPSERTAFEEYVIASLDPIAQHVQPVIANSLESAVASTTLILSAATTFPSERTAFECHATSAITSSLELAVAEPDEAISIEAIVEPVTAKPLGKAVTKKTSKRELSKLTALQLQNLITEAVKKDNSLVTPKSYKKAKKAVLVDWLMAN